MGRSTWSVSVFDFLNALWRAFRRVVLNEGYSVSSEERERLRQHVAESLGATMGGAEARMRRLHAPDAMRGAGIAEAMLELSHEYARSGSDQLLTQLNATEAELKSLANLRASASDEPEVYLAYIREYMQAHPGSRLGRGFLIHALITAGYTHEAISLCRQSLSSDSLPESNYNTHLLLGRLFLEEKDWDSATEQRKLAWKCESALPELRAEQESLVPVRILIARARRASGDESGARHLLRKCLNATVDQNLQEVIRNVMTEAGT